MGRVGRLVRQVVAVALAGALASACGTSPREAAVQAAPAPQRVRLEPRDSGVGPAQLSVASYNVNFGMAGDRDTVAAISELDADAIFLQETTARWAGVLREHFDGVFPHVVVRERAPAQYAVLSRYPVRERAMVPPAHAFPGWIVIVESPLGPVQVLNVHLYPPVRRARRVGWLRAYLDGQDKHVDELAAFYAQLDPDLPTLIVGDFNEDVSGKGVSWLRERGFAPALAGRQPTWHWLYRSTELEWQLDHVMHDARLRPVEGAVVRAGRSDHWPVTAVFASAADGAVQITDETNPP